MNGSCKIYLKLFSLSSGTPGECYSSTLGAALHELSHIFDLVHADSGIMARGFEDLDVFFLLNCDSHGRRTGIPHIDDKLKFLLKLGLYSKDRRQLRPWDHSKTSRSLESCAVSFRSANAIE